MSKAKAFGLWVNEPCRIPNSSVFEVGVREEAVPATGFTCSVDNWSSLVRMALLVLTGDQQVSLQG